MRRDVQPLTYLRTSFDDTLLAISTPIPTPMLAPTKAPEPARSPRMARIFTSRPPKHGQPDPPTKLQHRSSVFNLFSRPNVQRAHGHHTEPEMPAVPRVISQRESKRSSMSLKRPTRPTGTLSRQHKSDDALSRAPSSKLDRKKSMTKPGPNASAKQQPENPQQHMTTNWEPPPLFQAYPQAIKHSTLECTGSLQHQKSNPRLSHTRYDSSSPMKTRPGSSGFRPKSSKRDRTSEVGANDNRPSSRPGSSAARDVYILVTSGYLLRYAGEGLSDRKPLEVLKLGHKSAAFASDLIPGRHWVLQVLQNVTEGPGTLAPQKSFLSKLRMSTASKRRVISSMLLICDDPEQMNDWMQAMRKAIEQVGGPKSRPQTAIKRAPSEAEIKAQHRLSHRFPLPLSPRLAPPLSPHSPTKSTPSSPTAVNSDRTSNATAVGTLSDWSSNRSSALVASGLAHANGQKLSVITDFYEQIPEQPHHDEPSLDSASLHHNSSMYSYPNKTDILLTPDSTTSQSTQKATTPVNKDRLSLKSALNMPMLSDLLTPEAIVEESIGRLKLARDAEPDSPHSPVYLTPPTEAHSLSTPASSTATFPKTPQPSPSLLPPLVPSPSFMDSIPESSAIKSRRSPTKAPKQAPADQLTPASTPTIDIIPSPKTETTSHSPLDARNYPKRLSSMNPLAMNPSPASSPRRTSFRSSSPLPLRSSYHSAKESFSGWIDQKEPDAHGLGISLLNSTTSPRHSALLQLTGAFPPLDSPTLPPDNHTFDAPFPTTQTQQPLRRPANLRVNTDQSSFLARRTSRTTAPRLSEPQLAPTNPSKRSSVLVPVIRPAFRPRARSNRTSAMTLPPLMPPPVAPLPAPPSQVAV